jgi:hypothetical protein
MRGNVAMRMTAWLVLGVGAFLLASYCTAQESNGSDWDKEQFQNFYVEYLAEEGYRPEIDSDGDVRFKREGKGYFILVREDDPEFFCLVLPNIWPIESEAERAQVLAAADYSNARSKVSKVHTVDDDVWVTIELFVAKPEDFKGVFRRAIGALDNGAMNFVRKMRE